MLDRRERGVLEAMVETLDECRRVFDVRADANLIATAAWLCRWAHQQGSELLRMRRIRGAGDGLMDTAFRPNRSALTNAQRKSISHSMVFNRGRIVEQCEWNTKLDAYTYRYCQRPKGHKGEHDFSVQSLLEHLKSVAGDRLDSYLVDQHRFAPPVLRATLRKQRSERAV